MLRSLYSAVSGMNAFQNSLDVVGNNIANVDTTAFKASRAEFSDILSQTLSGASAPASPGMGGTNPQQIGLGVAVSAVYTPFTQGADQSTGVSTDVALDGNGFFMVSPNASTNQPTSSNAAPTVTPVGTNPVYFTRAGNFSPDANGNLVLPDGSKLLGYLSGTTAPTSPSQLSAVNISVIPAQPPGSTQDVPGNFSIGANGTITVKDPSTGNVVDTWIVPLAQFFNPSGLAKAGNNLYSSTSNSGNFAGTPTPATQGASIGQAGGNGFATFRVGSLEASDVNLTNEFTNMIIAQQGFDANSKVINTDNNILSTIQNLEQQA